MKRRKAYLFVAVLGFLALVVMIIVAYRGPTQAADPNKDYSQVNRPDNQVLSDTSTVGSPTSVPGAAATDANASTDVAAQGTSKTNATDKASDGSGNLSAPGQNGGTVSHDSSGSGTDSSGKVSSDITSRHGGLVESLVDVLNNIQL